MAYLSRAARREQIINAAVDLVSAESLAAATARRIAQATGCSLGQIHHHFASIDELLNEAVREVWTRIEPQLQSALRALPPRERLLTLVSGSMCLLPDNIWPVMRVAKVLWKDALDGKPAAKGAVAEGLSKMRGEILATLEEGMRTGAFPATLKAAEVTLVLMAASQGYDLLSGFETSDAPLPDKLAFMEGVLRSVEA